MTKDSNAAPNDALRSRAPSPSESQQADQTETGSGDDAIPGPEIPISTGPSGHNSSSERKPRSCCDKNCGPRNSKWRVGCYVVGGMLIVFGSIRMFFNLFAILYFIISIEFEKQAVLFFGGLVDPLASIFELLVELHSEFVMILVINMAARLTLETAGGIILIIGTVKKSRSFCMCFMRISFISLIYTLIEAVGYAVFLSKGFRISSGIGIWRSDEDILSVLFIIFHVVVVTIFRVLSFFVALKYRNEIPRHARRVNAGNFRHPQLHVGRRHRRRQLVLLERE